MGSCFESGFSGRSGEGGSGELVHAETVRERARSGLKIGLARKRRREISQGEAARATRGLVHAETGWGEFSGKKGAGWLRERLFRAALSLNLRLGG